MIADNINARSESIDEYGCDKRLEYYCGISMAAFRACRSILTSKVTSHYIN